MNIVLKIIDINEDEVVAESTENKILKIKKGKIPKFARIGDIIRHCEHGIFDVIDEDGNLIYR